VPYRRLVQLLKKYGIKPSVYGKDRSALGFEEFVNKKLVPFHELRRKPFVQTANVDRILKSLQSQE
jgi:hypothetical protein